MNPRQNPYLRPPEEFHVEPHRIPAGYISLDNPRPNAYMRQQSGPPMMPNSAPIRPVQGHPVAGLPPKSHPVSSGHMPPQQGHPQQGHPQQGHPQQGHPQQGHPQQGHPQQGHPQQGHPQQGHPQQGLPQQGHPQQRHPQQGLPPQGHPQQGLPPQGHPQQGHPPQGHPQQGHPPQGHPQQGHPPQGHPQQGHPPQGHPVQGLPQLRGPGGHPQQPIPGHPGQPLPLPGQPAGQRPPNSFESQLRALQQQRQPGPRDVTPRGSFRAPTPTRPPDFRGDSTTFYPPRPQQFQQPQPQMAAMRPPARPVRPGGYPPQQQAPQRPGTPHQYVAALVEKLKVEKEKYLGNQASYEKSKKRPLDSESRNFWDLPLPARLVAGISLLEADSALTRGHAMGGARDLWASLDPIPSPMSCGAQVAGITRFGGADSYRVGGMASVPPQEYLFTECSLMGVVDPNETPGALPALLKLLQSLSDVCQRGLWKDECWRLEGEAGGNLTFLQSTGKSARELWLRRYMLPEHLRNIFALRIYSAEYLAVPPSFPTNARKVKEATVAPSIVTIIDGLGFQRAPPNDVYAKGQIYHIDAGTSRHVIVSVKKFYGTRYMDNELFEGKIFVEAVARTERHALLNQIGQNLVDLSQRLKPHVHLMKV